jgi:hypothetical protein
MMKTTARAGRSASARAEHANKARQFYVVSHIWVRRFGFEFLNEEAVFAGGPPIFAPVPSGRGFRDYPEAPLFLADAKKGRIDRDFEPFDGYWLISERLKLLLDSVDPNAFAFVECKTRLPDGSEGPPRWLCDVVRVLDAVDEEKSTLAIKTATDDSGTKYYGFCPGERMIFREGAVGPSHVFRLRFSSERVVCDEDMRSACKAAGITGISFTNASRRN